MTLPAVGVKRLTNPACRVEHAPGESVVTEDEKPIGTMAQLDRMAESLPPPEPPAPAPVELPPQPSEAKTEPLPAPALVDQGGEWYVSAPPALPRQKGVPSVKLLHDPVDIISVKGKAFVDDTEVRQVPLDLTFLNADVISVEQLHALEATRFVSRDFESFIRDVVAGQCGLRFDFSGEAARHVMQRLGQSESEQAAPAAVRFMESQRMLNEPERRQALEAYRQARAQHG